MSGIRLLVGTRKGAFIMTSDDGRSDWQIDGPHFGGWEIYHMTASPADPDRLYASQCSDWFGQLIQRSDDGGRNWDVVSNEFHYTGEVGEHQWYDGSLRPWEFKRVWHLEPLPDDPDCLYAGVEDAALFRSDDGGKSWQELAGLRGHGTGPDWAPGAGGMCLHTILLHPEQSQRLTVRDLRRRRVSQRRRRRNLAAHQQGTAFGADSEPDGRGRSLCAPPGHAPVAARRPVHAEALGRHAQR